MASLNKMQLIGNLGADPEIRYLPTDGKATATVSVATTESWKDKTTGERVEKTEWHRVVFFGRLADIARDYLKKGSQIYVEGPLRTRSWEDNDEITRYTTEIVGRELKMLGKKPAEEMESAPYMPAAASPSIPDDLDDIPF